MYNLSHVFNNLAIILIFAVLELWVVQHQTNTV